MTSSAASMWETNLVTSLLVMTNQIVPPVQSLIQAGFCNSAHSTHHKSVRAVHHHLKPAWVSASKLFQSHPSALNTWKGKKNHHQIKLISTPMYSILSTRHFWPHSWLLSNLFGRKGSPDAPSAAPSLDRKRMDGVRSCSIKLLLCWLALAPLPCKN